MAPENSTIAEKWLEKIDRPLQNGGWTAGIDRNTVRRMKKSATEVIHEGNPRGGDLYVFADGTGLWEKRQDDWFTANPEAVAAAQGN